MTTREQQIEQAERIARLNPEWTWNGQALLWRRGYHMVEPSESGLTWCAYHRISGWIYNGRTCRIIKFRSPAAAIKALGFTIIEREQEP